MKKNYFLLLFIFCFSMQAQIDNLYKFSKGRYYSSDVITDEKGSVKGYFLLFETDKVAKETYELEYIVLDENLTKVTNGFIKEMKFESLLVKAKRVRVNASLSGKNNLLLMFKDDIEQTDLVMPGFDFIRYRILDITTNELSPPFIFNKDRLLKNPVFSRSYSDWEDSQSESIEPYNQLGLVVNSVDWYKGRKATERYLKCFDNNLEEKWKFVYEVNPPKKEIKNVTYLQSDEDVIAMYAQKGKFKQQQISQELMPEISIMFIDSKKGILRNEFIFPDSDKISYSVKQCTIKGDKIFVMGNYYTSERYALLYNNKNYGLYSFSFDKATGALISKDYLKWESFKDRFEVDSKGFIKGGFLYTHKMLLKENGDILVVSEPFFDKPIETNMFFFTFDSKLALKDVFEVPKINNKSLGKKYGNFDFMAYQNLGDDEYLFLLNENNNNLNKKKNATKYGIVSYSEGVFKKQTIDIKTEVSKVSVYNAKKGYLLVVEDFDDKSKSTEFRLEKINY